MKNLEQKLVKIQLELYNEILEFLVKDSFILEEGFGKIKIKIKSIRKLHKHFLKVCYSVCGACDSFIRFIEKYRFELKPDAKSKLYFIQDKINKLTHTILD